VNAARPRSSGSLGSLGIETKNRKPKIFIFFYFLFFIFFRIRADAPCFTPGNFKKDATVCPSHGRPRGDRPIVRPSENVRLTTLLRYRRICLATLKWACSGLSINLLTVLTAKHISSLVLHTYLRLPTIDLYNSESTLAIPMFFVSTVLGCISNLQGLHLPKPYFSSILLI
jgi:hypothetical protein